MAHKFSCFISAAAACLQLHGAGPDTPVDRSPGQPANQIRVRLYDYAAVSPSTLTRAQAAARRVFALAGVDLSWANCSHDPNIADDAECRLPITTSDLQLRIIGEKPAKRTHASRNCLGYALLAGEFSSFAWVFYHRALDLEKGNLVDRSTLLGAMMAHELGHLLLGERSHPQLGIMRGVWDEQDLKKIAKGRMWFTPSETARLDFNVERRQMGFGVSTDSLVGTILPTAP